MRSAIMQQKRPLFLFLVALAVTTAIWSFIALTAARTETLDQRVHDVASQLKCPVCQGESVADSPSTISEQMRGVIRQQLQSGQSEQQIIQYFIDRYGQQIAWSPPWQGFTLLAWLVPIVLLLGGAALLCFVLRDWRRTAPPEVTAEDTELANIDQFDLKRYRAQIEEELVAEDSIFTQQRMEAP